MPVQTGFGPLSLGRDVSLDAVLPNGQHLQISNITGFDAKRKSQSLLSKGIDGTHRTANIPETWRLTFNVDRQDSLLDDFFAAVEEGYFAGANLENCVINETITEADGSISQFRYEGCALDYESAGDWEADKFVKQRLAAECSRRRRVI